MRSCPSTCASGNTLPGAWSTRNVSGEGTSLPRISRRSELICPSSARCHPMETLKVHSLVPQPHFLPSSCYFTGSQSVQLSPGQPSPPPASSGKQQGASEGQGALAMKRPRSSSPELMRCKRRLNFAGFGYSLPPQQPQAVARRNERERNRVKLVNMGFATLREHVPSGAQNKKMSKVETLRSAVEYIRALQALLDEHDAVSAAFRTGMLSASPHGAPSMNSMAGSPVSSYSSDEGSYEPLSPEEQDLLDFTNWF